MNWDRVSGNWKQFRGKVQEQWGKLTDDELDQINGNREQLEGKIQERYGIAKDVAKKQLDEAYALGRDRSFALEGGGRRVDLRFGPQYPFAQIYALPGKPFVAIEPMTAPTNALVTGECPVVKPGERFTASFTVTAQ